MKLILTVAVILLLPTLAIAQPSLLDRSAADAAVDQQRTVALVNQHLANARQLLDQQLLTRADLELRAAERAVYSAANLPQADQQALLARVQRLSAELSATYAQAQQRQTEQTRAAIAERERLQAESQRALRQRQLSSQWARVRDYEQVNEYARAADAADVIVREDPADQQARRTRDRLQFYAEQKDQLEIRTNRLTQTKAALVDVEATAIPRDGLTYPSNWHELSARRSAQLAREARVLNPPQPAMGHLMKRLDMTLDGVTLDNVISYISDASQVPIAFDPRIADDTGLDPQQVPVTINARNLTLRQALDMVLPTEYGYRVQGDQLIVSSREKANPLRVMVYPIRHMIAEVPDFGSSVPKFNITRPMEGGDSPTTGTSGSSIWTSTITTEEKTEPEQKLIDLVTRFVRGTPDARVADWESFGGSATIEYFDGNLIVKQTDMGHRQVIEMLNRLR